MCEIVETLCVKTASNLHLYFASFFQTHTKYAICLGYFRIVGGTEFARC